MRTLAKICAEAYTQARQHATKLACVLSLVLPERTLTVRLQPFGRRRLITKQYPTPMCAECNRPNVEDYMVHDNVWRRVAGHRDFLHVACLEKRLGRRMAIHDFTFCKANGGVFLGYCVRLDEEQT